MRRGWHGSSAPNMLPDKALLLWGLGVNGASCGERQPVLMAGRGSLVPTPAKSTSVPARPAPSASLNLSSLGTSQHPSCGWLHVPPAGGNASGHQLLGRGWTCPLLPLKPSWCLYSRSDGGVTQLLLQQGRAQCLLYLSAPLLCSFPPLLPAAGFPGACVGVGWGGDRPPSQIRAWSCWPPPALISAPKG